MPQLLRESGLWCTGDLSAQGPPTSHLLACQRPTDDYVPWEPASPRLHIYLPATPRPSSSPRQATPRGSARSSSSQPPSSPARHPAANAGGSTQPACSQHSRPRSGSCGSGPAGAQPVSPRSASILLQAQTLQARAAEHSAASATAFGATAPGELGTEPPLLLVRSLQPQPQQRSQPASRALLRPRSSPRTRPTTSAAAAASTGFAAPRRPTSAAPSSAAGAAAGLLVAGSALRRGLAPWRKGGSSDGHAHCSTVPCSLAASFTAGAGPGAGAGAGAASRMSVATAWAGHPAASPSGAGPGPGQGLIFGPPYGVSSGHASVVAGGWRGGLGASDTCGSSAAACNEGWGEGADSGISGSSSGDAAGARLAHGVAVGWFGAGAAPDGSARSGARQDSPPDSPDSPASGTTAPGRAGLCGSSHPAKCHPQIQPLQLSMLQQQHHGQEALSAHVLDSGGGGCWVGGDQRARSRSGTGTGFTSPRSVGRSLSVAASSQRPCGKGTPRPASCTPYDRAGVTWADGAAGGGGGRAGGGTQRPSSALPATSHSRGDADGSLIGSSGSGAATVCGSSLAAAVLAAAPFEVVPDSAAARRASLLDSLAGGSAGRGCGRVGRAVVGILPHPHPFELAPPAPLQPEERVSQVLAEAPRQAQAQAEPHPAPAPPAGPTRQVIRMLTERRGSEAAAAAVDCAFSSTDPSAWMNQILAERAAALAAAAAAAAASGSTGGWAITAQDPAGSAPSSPKPVPAPVRAMQPQARQARGSDLGGGGRVGSGRFSEEGSGTGLRMPSSQLPRVAAAAQTEAPASPTAVPAAVSRHTSAEALHQHSLSYLASRDACRALAAASAPAPPGLASLRDTAQWLGIGIGLGGGGGAAGGVEATRPASASRLLTHGAR